METDGALGQVPALLAAQLDDGTPGQISVGAVVVGATGRYVSGY
jgi:hypothetical protein